ncbi:uncharacterized protein LOC118479016 [Aplysia californica]|uniref:Uncharacterized protein LOC118479016 n=1 Tax=Aplysia californica TaxID=6500 RepID=A0ABM1W451_APLCA|nr:uncharacterized protein LOC118479016 [Aplysia californica]
MDSLIDCLDTEKWQEIPEADKSGDFQEYFINRSKKQVDKTTICFIIENDTCAQPKKVNLEFCKKDPFKHVSKCEFRLSDDGAKVTGLDLDGDVVVLK